MQHWFWTQSCFKKVYEDDYLCSFRSMSTLLLFRKAGAIRPRLFLRPRPIQRTKAVVLKIYFTHWLGFTALVPNIVGFFTPTVLGLIHQTVGSRRTLKVSRLLVFSKNIKLNNSFFIRKIYQGILFTPTKCGIGPTRRYHF